MNRITIVSLLAVAVAAPPTAHATALCALPISAYLTDGSGAPVDGIVDLELRFYIEEDAGEPAECRRFEDTEVIDGWLRVIVDACAVPTPADCGVAPLQNLIGVGPDLFVGVVVGDGPDELLPRVTIGAVPYALTAFDAQNLGGEAPEAYESAGTADGLVGAHAADADAHHPSTSEGIAITPASATVDDVLIDGDVVDFGPDDDDELNAEIVRTLTGGGNADALHEHTGHGDGGGCYTAWGATTCLDGWSTAYDGFVLAVDGNGTRGLAGLYCFEDENLLESDSVGYYYRLLGPVTGGAFGDYQSTLGEMPCVVCCQ
jgi:hypothetical protein